MGNKEAIDKEIEAVKKLTPSTLDDLIENGLGMTLTESALVEKLMRTERDEILRKYHFPRKKDSKGYYRIYVDDMTAPAGRKQLYAMDLESLKEKVYRYEKDLPLRKPRRTFEFAFRFAQDFERNNVAKERQQSRDNTISKNFSDYKRFFEGTGFANTPIDKITVRDLDMMIRKTMKKYDLTQKGMSSLRGIINMTFKRAAYMEWIEENPASKIIWKDYRQLQRQPTAITERAYSDEEMKKIRTFLLKYQEEHPDYIPSYALEFQLITGMRRGEIPPLLWSDVDFSRGTIHVHKEQLSMQQKRSDEEFITNYTKNGKARFYPIADLERKFLDKLQKVHDKYYPESPFLFPADTKNGCITNNMSYQHFRRICRKLEIPVSKECIRGTHAFRRNAITEVVNMSNGNFVLTAQMFGNSPETIRKHYYVGENVDTLRGILNLRKAL